MEKYFVIHTSETEGLKVKIYDTAAELEKAIAEANSSEIVTECHPKYVEATEKILDEMSWNTKFQNHTVIIKGKSIIPQPVSVVSAFKVE
jgi:hypothetical protein